MMARDPEDQLRGIIETALDRHVDEHGGDPIDSDGFAGSVLAALADEIPDGFDDLLRTLAERQPGERDIESDILRVLAEADEPMPSGHIGSALQPPLVRPADLVECMRALDENGWLERTFPTPGPYGQRSSWSLTYEGYRAAVTTRSRARRSATGSTSRSTRSSPTGCASRWSTRTARACW
jgi:hypothetical protein